MISKVAKSSVSEYLKQNKTIVVLWSWNIIASKETPNKTFGKAIGFGYFEIKEWLEIIQIEMNKTYIFQAHPFVMSGLINEDLTFYTVLKNCIDYRLILFDCIGVF